MIELLIRNETKYLIISIAVASALSILSANSLVLIPFLIFIMCIYFWGERFLIGAIIVIFLATPREFFGESRLIINIGVILCLIILFIKRFGLSIKHYKSIPKELVRFLVLLFTGLMVSTIFSDDLLQGIEVLLNTFTFLIISYIFFSLLRSFDDYVNYIFAIVLVFLIITFRIFIDVLNLGVENYFLRSILEENISFISSKRYTEITIFFISLTLLLSLILIKKMKRYQKWLYILLVINCISLIFSNARGGMLAAIISVSFILYNYKKILFTKTIIYSFLLLLLLILLISPIEEAFFFLLRIETINTRNVFWNAGLEMFFDNLIFGIGPNGFTHYFFSYAPSSSLITFLPEQLIKVHPHNHFLFFAAENGILGLIICIYFFYMLFKLCYLTLNHYKASKTEEWYIAMAATGISLGIFIRSFFEVSGFLFYGFITTDLPFWIVFGILLSIYNNTLITDHK